MADKSTEDGADKKSSKAPKSKQPQAAELPFILPDKLAKLKVRPSAPILVGTLTLHICNSLSRVSHKAATAC